MTPENLRETWNQSRDSFSDYDNRCDVSLKTHTTLDRLADRYKRFAIVSGLMIIMTPCWIMRLIQATSEFKLLLVILYAVYFLIAGSIDLWLYGRIKGLDISSAPVKIIIEQTRRCRKVHLRSMIVLIPFAIVVVACTMWAFREEIYAIYGMICGIALGLLLGFLAFQKFMADYKTLLHNYAE